MQLAGASTYLLPYQFKPIHILYDIGKRSRSRPAT